MCGFQDFFFVELEITDLDAVTGLPQCRGKIAYSEIRLLLKTNKQDGAGRISTGCAGHTSVNDGELDSRHGYPPRTMTNMGTAVLRF